MPLGSFRSFDTCLKKRIEGFDEDFRLTHHAKIVGMRSINSPFPIITEHSFTREKVEFFESFAFELFHILAEKFASGGRIDCHEI